MDTKQTSSDDSHIHTQSVLGHTHCSDLRFALYPWCLMMCCDYHLDVGVASDCSSVGAMTVTKPTLCVNVRVIRIEVYLVSMVSGVLLSLN